MHHRWISPGGHVQQHRRYIRQDVVHPLVRLIKLLYRLLKGFIYLIKELLEYPAHYWMVAWPRGRSIELTVDYVITLVKGTLLEWLVHCMLCGCKPWLN